MTENPGFLDKELFRGVVAHVPLVSVDLIVINGGKVLLGRRVNKPARGFWFTPGGRLYKNETIGDALRRIAQTELGMASLPAPTFVGVFEHLYDDGIFEGVSTHYVNLAYAVEGATLDGLPREQHDAYRWFSVEELTARSDVHVNVKAYFASGQRAAADGRKSH